MSILTIQQKQQYKGYNMATNKLSFKTPLAELRWVTVTGKGKPKFGFEDSTDPKDHIYTATARLTEEQAKKVKDTITKFWEANKPKNMKKPKWDLVKPELDEDGNETGFYTIQAKTATVWEDGKPNKVKVLRANGNPVDLGDTQIGNGSLGVIHGDLAVNGMKPNIGVSFYLKAVQLKKLVPFTGNEVEADDLGDDEGFEDSDIDAHDISKTPEI